MWAVVRVLGEVALGGELADLLRAQPVPCPDGAVTGHQRHHALEHRLARRDAVHRRQLLGDRAEDFAGRLVAEEVRVAAQEDRPAAEVVDLEAEVREVGAVFE